MAYSFGLEFDTPYRKDGRLKPGRACGAAEARIFVKKVPYVTPDSLCIEELEDYINEWLLADLQEVKKAARRKFADHEERERRWKKRPREAKRTS